MVNKKICCCSCFLPHLLIPCESRRGVLGFRGARECASESRSANLNPYRLLHKPCKVKLTPHCSLPSYQAALLAQHIHASNCKGTGNRPLQCALTPGFTGVSSKNVSPDPYYCHSRALAVTLGVKCTCSPAVHGCTPTAFPERINAFCHRCQPVT